MCSCGGITLALPKGAKALTPTRTTCAASTFGEEAKMLPRVRMPLRAVRLGALHSAERLACISSPDVLGVSHRLQMIRCHTVTYSAQVIEDQTFGDGTDAQLVR